MKNLVVKKPWGEEYIACKCRKTATWLLKLDYKKKPLFIVTLTKKLALFYLMEKLKL